MDFLSHPVAFDQPALEPDFAAHWADRLYPLFAQYFRAQVRGLHHLPQGPFVGAGLHGGGPFSADAALLMARLHRERRATPHLTLVHPLVLDTALPPYRHFLRRVGCLTANATAAADLLRQGYSLMIYPGGELDAYKPWSQRHHVYFAGRKGYIRVALRAQAPIVPVVSIGGHELTVVLANNRKLLEGIPWLRKQHLHVWPVQLLFPVGLWVGFPVPPYVPLPAKIEIQILAPEPTDGYGPDAADDPAVVDALDLRIRQRMQHALDVATKGRVPFLGWRR